MILPVVGLSAVATLAGGVAAAADQRGEPRSPAPAAVSSQAPDPAEQTAQIRATWAQYTAAVAAGDLTARTALVTDSTVREVERLRDLALTESEAGLRGRSFLQQVMVYELRSDKVPLAVLRTTQGRQLYAELLRTSPLIRDAGLTLVDPSVTLADVRILPDGVSGSAVLVGIESARRLSARFRFEEGRWRVDLLPLLAVEAELFDLEARLSTGGDPAALLEDLLVEQYGQEVASRVRQPPGR